jgi:hypothetical protein
LLVIGFMAAALADLTQFFAQRSELPKVEG